VHTRRRETRFWASDRLVLSNRLQAYAHADGLVGEAGLLDLSYRAPYSSYGSTLRVLYMFAEGARIDVGNSFWQSSYGSALTLGDDVVAQLGWPLASWLGLNAGIAAGGYEEQAEERSRTAFREQGALGLDLHRKLRGQPLNARCTARAGATQVVGEGAGALLAISGHLDLSQVLRRVTLQAYGLGDAQWDWSPLGTNSRSLGAWLRASGAPTERLRLAGSAGVTHRAQDEPSYGTYTPSSTDLSASADFALAAHERVSLGGGAGYYRTIGGDVETDSGVYANLQASGSPLEDLNFSTLAVFSTRLRGAAMSYTQLRVDTTASWKIRQLSIAFNYQYRYDDYTQAHGGDHVVSLRILRHFEARFGRAE
jgi:hypothetical protein